MVVSRWWLGHAWLASLGAIHDVVAGGVVVRVGKEVGVVGL